MKVHSDIHNLPGFRKAVVTIGTFDGVHLGHRQIIDQLKKEALAIGGETVVVTFHPHPRKILPGHQPVPLINTLAEKTELLEAQGIDHLVVVPFTPAFSSQTAEQYVESFLIARFHPHTVIIGYDHRFGQNRLGDFHLLEKYAAAQAFKLIEIPRQLIDTVTISSTRIRTALLEGHVTEACRLLGYDYFFEGAVVEGNKLGRTLGYPTANLEVEEDVLVPGNGVYAVRCKLLATSYDQESAANDSQLTARSPQLLKGMMNIGVRPTIGGVKRVIEVNLFDFNQDIYGQKLRVYIKAYLRGEQKFAGLDKLKEQLAKDKEAALLAL
ncbi:MAG TPA: bifunctional riboflavin kinase/FAD synthetase [Chitinophagaceae bacterium]|jgi:riboflavin kinase/FMN adenylyltransferase